MLKLIASFLISQFFSFIYRPKMILFLGFNILRPTDVANGKQARFCLWAVFLAVLFGLKIHSNYNSKL